MTAQAFSIFCTNKDDIRINDLVGSNLRMCLVTSSFTPDTSLTGQNLYSHITNELATGNGYLSGGATLTGVVSEAGTTGYKLSSGNAVWTASGGSIPAFRYAILYYLGTLWGMVNPLIGYILCNNTPADMPATTDGNTLTITCPAGGWFDVT